jgi:poly(3-hydroxybutyrate) depolymerase
VHIRQFSVVLLLFCCPIASAGERLKSGQYLVSQTWSQEKDFPRPYHVNVPPHADQEKLPVFIFLHGNGGRAEGAMNGVMRRFKTIATRYVMVFPDGYAKSWNIVSERSKADDRAFIEAIVKKLASFDNVQSNSFTIMGTSNGAALVNQLAIECRLPNIRNYVSAVSPLNVYQHDGKNFRSKGADNNYREIAQPMSGKRLLNVSGTEDRLVPYHGGPSPAIPTKDGTLAFVDAEESTFLWAKQMGYQGSRLSNPTLTNGKLEIFSYLDGDVVHVKVNGEGHSASRVVSEKTLLDFLAGGSNKDKNKNKQKDNETISPASTMPDSTPWDLAKLSEVPEFKWDAGEEIRSLYYSGEPFKGKPTRVFAYYASPATVSGKAAGDKKFPAIVLVHGGGGTAFPQWAKLWAERGYAAIAMDLAGCGPNRVRLPDGGPGQGHDMKFETIGKAVTEQWTYHAVANVIRAHSLIRSLPEVDSSRTAVTGISWGGYLTCIVSGLDNRFQAAVPVYGCGFLHENSAWLGDFSKMSAENKAKWIKLWDPSRYVGLAAMPMLFVNGGKDFAYPPDSHAKTYGLVKSAKYLHFVPDLPHGHIFDRPSAVEHFIDSQLNGGPPLSRISKPTLKNGKALGTVDTTTSLVEAALHFTTARLSGDARTREWTSRPATINGKTIAADSPPDDATAWFLTVKDERDVLTASPLVVRASEHPKNRTSLVDPDH